MCHLNDMKSQHLKYIYIIYIYTKQITFFFCDLLHLVFLFTQAFNK